MPPAGATQSLATVGGVTPTLVAPPGAVAQPVAITASTGTTAPAGFPTALITQLGLPAPVQYITFSGPGAALQRQLHLQIPTSAFPGAAALNVVTLQGLTIGTSASLRAAAALGRKPADAAATPIPVFQVTEQQGSFFDLRVQLGTASSDFSGTLALIPTATAPAQTPDCFVAVFMSTCVGTSSYSAATGVNSVPLTVSVAVSGAQTASIHFPTISADELADSDCQQPQIADSSGTASGRIPLSPSARSYLYCSLDFDVTVSGGSTTGYGVSFAATFRLIQRLGIAFDQPIATGPGNTVFDDAANPRRALIQEQINGSSAFTDPVAIAARGPLTITTAGSSPTCDAASFFFSSYSNGSVTPIGSGTLPPAASALIATNTSSSQVTSAGCRLIFSDGVNSQAIPFLFNPFTATVSGGQSGPDPTLKVSTATGMTISFAENSSVYTATGLPVPTGLIAPPHPLYYGNAAFLLSAGQLVVPDCRDVINVQILPPVPGVVTNVLLQSNGPITQSSVCALYLQDDALNQPFVLPVTLNP